MIDGASDTTSYYNQAAGIPGIEAVQEFRIYTSAYAPEFGHTSGGDVSYALKSGSNAHHGPLFEYLPNSDLDSDRFNANKAGQCRVTPRPLGGRGRNWPRYSAGRRKPRIL